MKKKPQKPASIYITEPDYQRLGGLIEITRERKLVDREYLNKLEAELDRAEIVDPKQIPADVITMRSKVRLKDLVSGEANTYSHFTFCYRLPVVGLRYSTYQFHRWHDPHLTRKIGRKMHGE